MVAEANARAVAMRASAREIRIPSVPRCWFMISVVKLLLKIRGFGRTIQWIRQRVKGVAAASSVDVETVKRAEFAVAMTGAFYPGRALCLEQSLTLYYLLRRQGIGVKYCQGVQPYPFEAHAWIEYRGEVINDVAEHARLFARLPEQLP
jgi:hypothetical protein